MIDRLSLDGSKHPNFMGCWMLENSSLCDDLIGFFERNKDSQKPGITGDGKLPLSCPLNSPECPLWVISRH